MSVIIYLFFCFPEEKKLYLPTDETTELYLLAFLRVCKFYPDSAFKRVSIILFRFHISTYLRYVIQKYHHVLYEQYIQDQT